MTKPLATLYEPVASPNGDVRLAALAHGYLQSRMRCDRLREELGHAEGIRDGIMLELIQMLDACGLKSVRTDDGLFTIASKAYYSLPSKAEPDARRQALRWLARVGGKELIEASIHHSTLNAFLRERGENDMPVSPLLREVTERYLQVRQK